MVSVFDVAAYILQKRHPISALKLQKLVYYCQAWSLVWDERPLFDERIEAWANGPVVPELYREHRGDYTVSTLRRGDPDCLSRKAKETVDAVLSFYGDRSPQWLSDLTHMETPWIKAYGATPPGQRCRNEISLADMAEYYEGLRP